MLRSPRRPKAAYWLEQVEKSGTAPACCKSRLLLLLLLLLLLRGRPLPPTSLAC